MIREIVQHPDPRLRETSKAVPPEQIPGEEVQQTIAAMRETLAATDDGVAISAPQIGELVRIFVVSGRVFDHLRRQRQSEAGETEEAAEPPAEPDQIFINPEMIKVSQETQELDEGCLSVRHYFGLVARHRQATVRAYNESGQIFTEGRSGLLAQIFQHEIDHLNGVLFIDKAREVEYRPPQSSESE